MSATATVSNTHNSRGLINPRVRDLQSKISIRKGLVGCGSAFTVALSKEGSICHAGDNRHGQIACTAWENVLSVFCGPDFVVGLHTDGSVSAAGHIPWGQDRLSHWFCIRSVACGSAHVAAVTQNGQVWCVGDNAHGQCNTDHWKNMVDVCCGNTFTAGLTKEGNVCMAGGSPTLRRIVSHWKNVVGLFADQTRRAVYAIDVKGRLLSSRPLPPYARSWRNLVYVAGAGSSLYGITSDGELLSDHRTIRKLAEKASNVTGKSGWVACEAGHRLIAALRQDGRVICEGQDNLGQAQSSGFVPGFSDYASFSESRKAVFHNQENVNRTYQRNVCLANRFKKWISCSEQATSILDDSGRIASTGKFRSLSTISSVCQIESGNAHLLALHTNGTVSAAGNNTDGCTDVSGWQNIRSVTAGRYHSLGLTMDGTVVFAGRNQNGRGDVLGWNKIKSVCGNDLFTIGLTWEGRLVATHIPENNSDPEEDVRLRWNACLDEIQVSPLWQNIVQVVVSEHHISALRQDGTVVTIGDLTYQQVCRHETHSTVLPWPRIRAIAAGSGYTVGLCYGGTVVALGLNDHGQCDTAQWTQVVAIDCGNAHTVGLRSDGHVLSCGKQKITKTNDREKRTAGHLPCQTSAWEDIVSLRCGPHHTVAVSRSGHLYACGRQTDGQCDVSAFLMFNNLDKMNRNGARLGICRQPVASAATPKAPASTREASAKEHAVKERHPIPFRLHLPTSLDALRADSESYRSRIAGSTGHVSVLNDQGHVVSLSLDSNNLVTDIPAGSAIRAISAGSHHTAMLTHDGHVRIRSTFKAGTPLLPITWEDPTDPAVASIASGASFAALHMTDGTVRLVSTGRPLAFSAHQWTQVTSISAGSWHLSALCTDGTVRSVGVRNRSLDPVPEGSTPWDADGWTGMTSVISTTDATVGFLPDGSIRVSGYATAPDSLSASDYCDWNRVIAVASSGDHLVALQRDGHVRACGSNQSGECNVQEWDQILMIAVRNGVTFGLRADGQVLTAGRCEFAAHRLRGIRALFSFGGTLVFLTAGGNVLVQRQGSRKEPWLVRSLSVFTPRVTQYSIFNRIHPDNDPRVSARLARTRLARGMDHAVYLDENNLVQTVGSNHYGQRDTNEGAEAQAVSCGLYHTALLLRDGHIRLAGKLMGEDPSPLAFDKWLAKESDTDAKAEGRDRFVAVACGYRHTVAIRGDGQVFAVGDNQYGQCSVQKMQRAIDLSCGVRHTAVLLEDGQVRAVGDNRYGQCNTNTWRDISMTACGEFHTVGLKTDGTLVVTGSDAQGQCNLSDLCDVVSVACLAEATVCVRADGSVIIRGNHHLPEETVSRLREVVAVRTCEYRLMALTADGRILFHPQT